MCVYVCVRGVCVCVCVVVMVWQMGLSPASVVHGDFSLDSPWELVYGPHGAVPKLTQYPPGRAGLGELFWKKVGAKAFLSNSAPTPRLSQGPSGHQDTGLRVCHGFFFISPE